MKVKIFDCEHEQDLEKEINDFIEKIENEHMEVKDINYSTSMGRNSWGDEIYIYSALIMYKKRTYEKPSITKDMFVGVGESLNE